jgi:hypothetical protein
MLAVTVSVAAVLVADPELFVATHRNCTPFKLLVTLLTVNVAIVAPLYGGVFVRFVHVVPAFIDTCHWSVGTGVPLAAAVKVAFAPAVTV